MLSSAQKIVKITKISSSGGLEPPTSRLTVERASRLRHEDMDFKKEYTQYSNLMHRYELNHSTFFKYASIIKSKGSFLIITSIKVAIICVSLAKKTVKKIEKTEYLNDNIVSDLLEYPMTVFDATQESDLLDAEFNEDFSVTGTCDAIISSTDDVECMIQASHDLFELKKRTNTNTKTNQAILEILSAVKRSNFPVIMVVTDLNDFWKLFWIEEIPKNPRRLLSRICSVEVSKNLAVGFLRYHLKLVAKMRAKDEIGFKVDLKYATSTRTTMRSRQRRGKSLYQKLDLHLWQLHTLLLFGL
jgi:hypothetical protein